MRLTNYYEHPGDNRYYVFRYDVDGFADEFETLLKEQAVEYERYHDTESEPPSILFGVHRSFLKQAMWCNNIVYGRHRKPFIPNAFFRWALIVVTAAMIALAVVGYLMKP